MNTSKKLSIIALLSLISSVALPTGRGGAASNPMAYGNTASTSDISDAYGASNFDSQGLTQPALLDASDKVYKGDSFVNLDEPGLEIATPTMQQPLALNQLGKGGHGIQKKQPKRYGQGGILDPEYNDYIKALRTVHVYKKRAAKNKSGTLTPGYADFVAADKIVTAYETKHPVAQVEQSSNEIIN